MKKTITLLMLLAAFGATAQLQVATFDDLTLAPESWWVGDTDDEDYFMGSFESGSFEFANLYWADYDSWAFFGYSNCTSTAFSSYVTDQMNSAAGHGVDGSANYGVLYDSSFMGYSDVTLSTDAATVVPGVYVTNSAWVVYSILNGDGMSPAFAQGDYFTLTVKALVDGQPNGKEVTFYLADYRSENSSDWYYLTDWRYMSLEELGEVTGLRFSINSSKVVTWGISTPTYCCIDNLGATVSTSGVSTVGAVSDRVEVYTLEGRYAGNTTEGLNAGVYIVRRGNEVRKVRI